MSRPTPVTLDELRTLDERGLRAASAPRAESVEDVADLLRALIERDHDYGTCVYAMSIAAEAAFRFVASRLGVTGFQASCADLDVLRRTRGYRGPFMVVDLADALYPQYDLDAELREFVNARADWLRDEAVRLLAESGEQAHPDVVAHWQRLAGGAA